MKEILTDARQCVGKTVTGIHHDADSARLLIAFDDAAIIFTATGNEEGAYLELDASPILTIYSPEVVEIGICAQSELDDLRRKFEQEYQERSRAQRREQYEKLKREFGTDAASVRLRELSVPDVLEGHNRQWVKCRECGRVSYYDYLPGSLSTPIMTLPCNHGAAVRFDQSVEFLSPEAAYRLLSEEEGKPQ